MILMRQIIFIGYSLDRLIIQARELTQLQSILQNQVERHGSHMFKEGSIVIPGINYLTQMIFQHYNLHQLLQVKK